MEAILIGRKAFEINKNSKQTVGNLLACFAKLEQKDSVKKYIDIASKEFDLTLEEIDFITKKYQH